jgi:hypothetical protein
MDILKSIEILEHLADSLDPFTKEPLAEDDALSRPGVIKALMNAIAVLKKEEKRIQRQKDLPGRVGQSWSDGEDKSLIAEFDCGRSIDDLACRHKRTRGAIRARLIRLGKIKSDYSMKTPKNQLSMD